MKIQTEKELFINNQHFAFKLRKLYKDDFSTFKQIVDYIPLYIQTTNIKTLDTIFSNNYVREKSKELENLVEYGAKYLEKISCPFLLENLKIKSTRFMDNKDFLDVCQYPQKIKVNNKMTYFYSNKLLLDDNQFFIVSNQIDDFGKLGKVFTEIFSELTSKTSKWLSFQSLTKQEKIILKLLAKGSSNKEVAELLFISSQTIHTHRRNIYKKLDINNISQLIRFSIALELLD